MEGPPLCRPGVSVRPHQPPTQGPDTPVAVGKSAVVEVSNGSQELVSVQTL